MLLPKPARAQKTEHNCCSCDKCRPGDDVTGHRVRAHRPEHRSDKMRGPPPGGPWLPILSIMFLRPATTLSTTAFRSAGCSARQLGASRLYSTGSQPKNSNTPLYLTLGGIAGIGAWYGLGGFDGKSKLGQVKADGGAALDGNEFRGFKLREVKPYNHDSSVYELSLIHI